MAYDYIHIPGAFYTHGLDLQHIVALSVIYGSSQGKVGVYMGGPQFIAICCLVTVEEAEKIIKDLWDDMLIERVCTPDGEVGWQVA